MPEDAGEGWASGQLPPAWPSTGPPGDPPFVPGTGGPTFAPPGGPFGPPGSPGVPPFGQFTPGPWGPAGFPPVRRTSGLAVASLVLAILGLCWIGSILGIVFGVRARRQIRRSGGLETGYGLATAGMVIGIVYICLTPLVLAVAIPTSLRAASSVAHKLGSESDDDVRQTLVNDLHDADVVFARRGSYAGITSSDLGRLGASANPTPSCGVLSEVCFADGAGDGYSYIQLCSMSISGNSWLTSQTSGGMAYYGKLTGSCPSLGDPGSPDGTPVQQGTWSTAGFP